jgi:hypothetical protein
MLLLALPLAVSAFHNRETFQFNGEQLGDHTARRRSLRRRRRQMDAEGRMGACFGKRSEREGGERQYTVACDARKQRQKCRVCLQMCDVPMSHSFRAVSLAHVFDQDAARSNHRSAYIQGLA